MSIKQNITSLQDLLEQVNALPDAGTDLPELTNEGTAADLAIGKQLIDSEGNVVTGTILHENRTFTIAPLQDDDTYISSKYYASYEKRIIGDGAYLKIRNKLSNFGDVSADEVMSGKTFTSIEGLKKTGTFSIDEELSTQDDLIAQIQAAVNGLPEAGSGSSGNIETATVEIRSSDDSEIGAVVITYENNNYKPVTWHLAPAMGGSNIFSNVVIGSYVFITLGRDNEGMLLELTGSLEKAVEFTFTSESTRIIVIKVDGNGSIRFLRWEV